MNYFSLTLILILKMNLKLNTVLTTVFLFIFCDKHVNSYSDDYCSWPLLEKTNATLTASSKLPKRGPESARIGSHTSSSGTSGSSDFDQYIQIDLGQAIQRNDHTMEAWQPSKSDYDQWLIINLRNIKKISKIGTVGVVNQSYVSEYALQISQDNINWGPPLTNSSFYGGLKELFKGNSDGENLHMNTFQTPIISQYVRINPTRWNARISMRVELYGCDYVSEILYFKGNSLVYRNLTSYPIQSRKDTIKFRFKTVQPDGILMYSKGTQSDFFALQLIDSRMVLNINLGTGPGTSVSAGSLLDDNRWHNVIIERYLNHISFTVDRVEVKEQIKGDFQQLDLNKILYIGGSPFKDSGLMTAKNFTGCLKNLYLNNTNVIYRLQKPPDASYYYNDMESPETFHKNNTFFTSNCPESNLVPITFLPSRTGHTYKSYVKLKGYEGIQTLNVSFEFRTYQDFGVIMYHKFTSNGFAKLYLKKSKLLMEIQSPDSSPRLVLDNFATDNFNDGLWHRVIFTVSTNVVTLSVDERMVRTSRLIKIFTGGDYYFGGSGPGGSHQNQLILDSPTSTHSKSSLAMSTGTQTMQSSTLISTNANYIGCFRQIYIDGNFQNPVDWKDYWKDNSTDQILFNSCQMLDRCNPNPCEHGGKCKQNSLEFECNCEETGYAGATCHMPLFPLSCKTYEQNVNSFMSVTIDIDGSGPLQPFPVTCQFYHDGNVETILHHSNEDTTLVNGYDAAGSFNQDIFYDAGYDQILMLLNRSSKCRQFLRLDCKNSRLFNSPSSSGDNWSPATWWVSRQNTRMDYWGGSILGSRKCECGILGQCEVTDKWCNCDSGLDTWLSDEGWLNDMTYLPVRSLRVGDTGTVTDDKQAKYTLGPLICQGDALYDNEITFRLPDASLQFPLSADGDILSTHSWDIFLEFKTTTNNAVILHAKGVTDFIKIEIINGNLLKFQVKDGAVPLEVNIQTTGKLNDNQWHSVYVEKNRKQSRIVLDGSQSSTVLQPPGQQRTIELTSDLFVGSSVDFRDGYVGCLRSLLVNGVMFDLRAAAAQHTYGIGLGCTGKCDSGPCLNNGTCDEGYDHYDCDCRFTAFKGPICADEIGINLQSNSYIKYDLKGSYKSTIAEKIRVGFTTTEPKGFLVGLFSNRTGEYLTLMVSNSGHLRLVFDFGFERQELIFPDQNFATGQYHDVQIARMDSGTKLVMKVDNLEPQIYTFDIKASADAQFNNIEYLYIGKNETMREGYIGCISRVEFDDQYPLKYYFQENRPKTIRSYPEDIVEDFCSVEPVTHPPEIPESRPLPKLDEEKLRRIYRNSTVESSILREILAIIFLLIVIFGILIGCYRSQHKGQYLTHEDDGAIGATDSNDAVVKSTTGHNVDKKQEWFI